jgi:hypothetical protein
MSECCLAPKQQAILDFIKAEIAAGRDFPAKRVIANHMGWKNVSGVYDVMHLLSGLGFLTRAREGAAYRFGLP